MPPILNCNLYDRVIPVSDGDAQIYARRLASEEGIFSGISTGAVLAAAIQLARQQQNQDKTIVMIQSSFGERYLSDPDSWLSWQK